MQNARLGEIPPRHADGGQTVHQVERFADSSLRKGRAETQTRVEFTDGSQRGGRACPVRGVQSLALGQRPRRGAPVEARDGMSSHVQDLLGRPAVLVLGSDGSAEVVPGRPVPVGRPVRREPVSTRRHIVVREDEEPARRGPQRRVLGKAQTRPGLLEVDERQLTGEVLRDGPGVVRRPVVRQDQLPPHVLRDAALADGGQSGGQAFGVVPRAHDHGHIHQSRLRHPLLLAEQKEKIALLHGVDARGRM